LKRRAAAAAQAIGVRVLVGMAVSLLLV